MNAPLPAAGTDAAEIDLFGENAGELFGELFGEPQELVLDLADFKAGAGRYVGSRDGIVSYLGSIGGPSSDTCTTTRSCSAPTASVIRPPLRTASDWRLL